MAHTGTPDDHTFKPVKGQTGCERCGYARGHHPTRAMLQAALVLSLFKPGGTGVPARRRHTSELELLAHALADHPHSLTLEQWQAAARQALRRLQARVQTAHARQDPHCTCNDCMADFIEQQQEGDHEASG